MIKALFISLTILAFGYQSCTDGCLVCNEAQECLFPDTQKGFYLEGTDVDEILIEKCLLTDIFGVCLYCDSGYILSTVGNKCVIVEEDNKIDNCKDYNSLSACSLCEKDYFLENAKCSAVTEKVDNCLYYQNNKICLNCEENYLVGIGGKNCIPNPDVKDCIAYSHVKCDKCDTGYVDTLNGYLRSWVIFNDDHEKNILNTLILFFSESDVLLAQTTCEAALTKNCAQFEPGRNICNVCAAGYFMDENKDCIIYPENPLVNCLVYSSVNTCVSCIAAHHFVSGVCTAITTDKLIQNCITYDTTSSAIKCLACSDISYLSNFSCKDRVISKDNLIANCETKNPTADNCGACKVNFYLTDDKRGCLPVLPNCKVYQSVTKDGPLKCHTCESSFVLIQNTVPAGDNNTPHTECVNGSITHCDQYNTKTDASQNDVCIECVDSFIHEGGSCVKNNNIEECTDYSSTDKRRCNTCDVKKSFNFLIFKRCRQIPNKVLNCADHDSGTIDSPNCGTCIDGYQLSGDSCIEINISNCKTINVNSKCTHCKTEFAVSRAQDKCLNPLSYISNVCAENSTKDSSNDEQVKDVACITCKEGHYPINKKDHYICAERDKVDEYHATNQLVSNCIKYNANVECTQCDWNSNNKFLSTTKTCVASCTDDGGSTGSYDRVKIVNAAAPNATDFEISSFNVCRAADDVAGCFIYAPQATGDLKTNICVRCKEGFIPKVTNITASNGYSLFENGVEGTASYPYISGPFDNSLKIDACVAFGALTINSVAITQNLADKCVVYEQTVNDFYCRRCVWGSSSPAIPTKFLLTDCQSDQNFSSDKLYNIESKYARLLSVHKCSDPSKIPFIFAEFDDSNILFTNWDAYNPNSTGTLKDAAGTGKNIVCAENSHNSFPDITLTTDQYKVPSGCAIAAYDITAQGISNGTSQWGNFCVACKPGYKIKTTGTGNYTRGILECEAIANCDMSTGRIANLCETCSATYIHEYSGDNIQFDSCISIPNSLSSKLVNCAAATKSGNNAEECMVCKKGFHLNPDGYCEKIEASNCEAGHFRVSQPIKTAQIAWKTYQLASPIGCNKCGSSFFSILVSGNHNLCFQSDWVTNNIDSLQLNQTEFIPFCLKYDAVDASNYTCKECKSTYVIKNNGEECFANTNLPNCVRASDSNRCIECVDSTFSLQNNTCVLGSIANCKAYFYQTNNSIIKCEICEDGFYLTSNTCLKGIVPNCLQYQADQKSKCSVCDDGYTTAVVKDNDVICFPKTSELDCDGMDYINDAVGGKLTCTSCVNTASHLPSVPTVEENHTICIDYATIPNCIDYDIGVTLSDSSFRCKECSEKFYLDEDSNTCIERQNVPAKCTKLTFNADTCSECGSNSYLHDSNKQCKNFPDGILGCAMYSDKITCSACMAGRFLDQNKCVKADPEIEGCEFYSSNTVCNKCKTGFFLTNNTCPAVVANDCATYNSINECASCNDLGGLKPENNIINCETQTRPNCLVVNDNSPYPCTLCQSGFYLDNGDCKGVTLINDCIEYESADTCKLCRKGLALSVDKKSCTTEHLTGFINGNCLDTKVVATPVCSVCKSGYYFEGNECKQLCTREDRDRCLVCTIAEPHLCVICASGNHMTTEGHCVSNQTPLPEPCIDCHSSIMTAVFLLALYLALWL